MENKRSVGITIFGWALVIYNLFIGLIGLFLALSNRKSHGDLFFALGPALSFAFLICGIFILKLKSWARKLIIILSGIGAILNIWLLFGLNPTRLGIEFNKLSQNEKVGFISFSFMMLAVIVWNIGVIYFFTRSKVKEQFK